MDKELKKAYEELETAARNLLELSESDMSGDYIVDPENYDDLSDAHLKVYRAKQKMQGPPATKAEHNRRMFHD